MLDPVLAAVEGLDVTVLYANTVRPFDSAGLRAALGPDASVALVEPYLAGTSSRLAEEVLVDEPRRLLGLGIERAELRRYGTPEELLAANGLDAAALRASITRFTERVPA